jgi:hypothetical protein
MGSVHPGGQGLTPRNYFSYPIFFHPAAALIPQSQDKRLKRKGKSVPQEVSGPLPPAEVLVKHFSEASWADFARNVVATGTKMTMQRHIDEGCRKCANVLNTWQMVHSIAQKESALTPPSDVVRVVKSQFAAVAPEKSLGFRLLFDSALAPVAAGMRGSVAARQFLYETDEYYIDLRVEPHREAHQAALVGQVLNRTGKRAAQGLAVLLQDGKRPIAETSTNQFGEFQFEFDATDSLSISVSREKSDAIVLPLYGIQGKPTDRKHLD